MNLTDHFTFEEMVLSETAARKCLDNTPTAETVANLTVLAQYLERIRARVRAVHGQGYIAITSGYRAPEVNAAVGGKPTSYHCFGLAADIHVPGMGVLALARFIADNFDDYDQLIFEFDSWVHVGIPKPGEKPRRQQLTINHAGTLAGLQEVSHG